jgi:hypothetical protein
MVRPTFPLTEFMVRLLGMTPEELADANPRRAARTYGIRSDWAAAYIAEQRALRGIKASPASDPRTAAPMPERRRQEEQGTLL